jgi:hypothetical protein
MSLFHVKRGDTHLPVVANMDLSGSTVKAFARPNGSDTAADELAVTVADAGAGLIHVATGTLTAGQYDFEVEVTQGSTVVTFPDSGWDMLVVVQDLG